MVQDDKPWAKGKLIRRYKRFLADVETPEGETITIHCPNTGSMRHCIVEGSDCWYSRSDSKTRKYPHTWEVATTPGGYLAGINTGLANALVGEALAEGSLAPFAAYKSRRAEVKYGAENSRIDFLLSESGADEPDCYLEVKSVTLMEARGEGFFPDAVSSRGAKHLRELAAMRRAGHRAALVYCVQHTGIERVSPADHIDPKYGESLREAMAQGVEVYAYGVDIQPQRRQLAIRRELPVVVGSE